MNKRAEVPFKDCDTAFFLYEDKLFQKMAPVFNSWEDCESYNAYNINWREPDYIGDDEKVIPVDNVKIIIE